ncbi:hypothetical protein B9Z55_021426 [Caenorhabditis nigoni]|nr:hypothetical protein B9Z55_021426 [Caenorhabditis nigoni]
MPYAYDWLSKERKSNILGIKIIQLNGKLLLYLQPRTFFEFEINYEKNGNHTLVTYERKELFVQNHFVNVFFEDLKMVLENQKTAVNFDLFLTTNEDSAKISEFLEESFKALKTRCSELKVNRIFFEDANVTFGMSVLKYLSSEILSSVIFRRPAEPINFQDSVNGLRNLEGGYRFQLGIGVRTIDEEDLISINQFASFSEIISGLEISSFSLAASYDSILNKDEFHTIIREKASRGPICIIEFKDQNPELKTTLFGKRKTPINSDVCEETARSVLENPLLMQLILKRFVFFEIESLRKVNRGVRKCIDTVKPNLHIEKYRFLLCNNRLLTDITLGSGEHKRLVYPSDGSSVMDKVYREPTCTLLLNDFETNIEHPKSFLQELSMKYLSTNRFSKDLEKAFYGELLKEIGKVLKKREIPLKIRQLSMGTHCQMEVMEILPAIDKDSLKIILFACPSEQKRLSLAENNDLLFKVDQLSQTDQWKSAEQLVFYDFTLKEPIEEVNIFHFSNLDILVKTLSTQNVFYLKTNLLKSSKFQKYKIHFRESTIDESLHELIGDPYRTISDEKKIWYFRIPNTNYFIHIVLDTRYVKNRNGSVTPKSIIFTRVSEEDTPFFEPPINQLRIN